MKKLKFTKRDAETIERDVARIMRDENVSREIAVDQAIFRWCLARVSFPLYPKVAR